MKYQKSFTALQKEGRYRCPAKGAVVQKASFTLLQSRFPGVAEPNLDVHYSWLIEDDHVHEKGQLMSIEVNLMFFFKCYRMVGGWTCPSKSGVWVLDWSVRMAKKHWFSGRSAVLYPFFPVIIQPWLRYVRLSSVFPEKTEIMRKSHSKPTAVSISTILPWFHLIYLMVQRNS